MFGADIAYMEGCMEDESFTDSYLPEYLYPAFRLPNPWHRQPDITQLDTDIIVIAEFSELEGPKPVVNKIILKHLLWSGRGVLHISFFLNFLDQFSIFFIHFFHYSVFFIHYAHYSPSFIV